MADIRDWDAYKRSRWNWTSLGYETPFPRGIAFTDVDAVVEMNRHYLFIETKHSDGPPYQHPPMGQRLFLERLASLPGVAVFVVYGDAENNLVRAVRQYRWNEKQLHSTLRDFTDSPDIEGPAFLKRAIEAFIEWAERKP